MNGTTEVAALVVAGAAGTLSGVIAGVQSSLRVEAILAVALVAAIAIAIVWRLWDDVGS